MSEQTIERKVTLRGMLMLSVVFDVVGFAIFFLTTASGYGPWVVAKLLFPYSAVLATLTTNGGAVVAVALLQYPVYGVALWAGSRLRERSVAWIVPMVHSVAVLVAFVVVKY